MASTNEPHVTPEHILQLGFAFWGSKTLLSAIELGLFTQLADGALTAEALRQRMGLHARAANDFFDALVALGMLAKADERYSNTPEADLFLDRRKPSYIGGILEMANARLYPFWGALSEALTTGEPQNEAKRGENFFASLYADQGRLKGFAHAMTGLSIGTAIAIAEKFPWKDHKTFVDVGAAEGALPVQLALHHPHLVGGGFDLPPLAPIFNDYVGSFNLGDRLRFHPGDFFADPLPSADVLVMGHILHDWNLEEKRQLISKAFAALPSGGALIIYEALIDDERRQNTFGLLMSLNMLIETPGGFDYTGADCMGWLKDAGFSEAYTVHLVGPDSMVVGMK